MDALQQMRGKAVMEEEEMGPGHGRREFPGEVLYSRARKQSSLKQGMKGKVQKREELSDRVGEELATGTYEKLSK